MSRISENKKKAGQQFSTAAKCKAISTKQCLQHEDSTKNKPKAKSPVTLRLSHDERAKLEELADGMTMSAYIRACIFAKDVERRKHRPKNVIEDKKAAAEALALLGQSRIASNLNQLAYHANVVAFIEDEEVKAQILEAHEYVSEIRRVLMKALGKASKHPSGAINDSRR